MGNVKSKKCKRARECKSFDISVKETTMNTTKSPTTKDINKLDTNNEQQHSNKLDSGRYNHDSHENYEYNFFAKDEVFVNGDEGGVSVDHVRHHTSNDNNNNDEFNKFVKTKTSTNKTECKKNPASTITNVFGIKRVDHDTFDIFVSNSENQEKSTMITIKM